MKRILFVDDEVNVLDGLRALLRKLRHEWKMEFALGGEEALALLADATFDVVVTDLRMPRVDGVAVLKHLHEHHPHTMRVVLSGDAQRASALAAIPHAHQALTKPCRLGELESVLARASLLGDLIADPEVRSIIGQIGELPQLPSTYQRLVRVLDDEKSVTADVAAVVNSDIAATAKVLQLANSALFGGGRNIATVVQAIQMLGRETLKTLFLTSALFGAPSIPAHLRPFAEDLHEHSALIAGLASELVGASDRRDAFAAGMLHDVGRLVLASTMFEEADDCLTRHAKVGGYLLGLWGIPPTVIDAVARHHDGPDALLSPVAHAVTLAEQIALEVTDAPRPRPEDVEQMRKLAQERSSMVGTRDSEEGRT